MSSIRAGLIFWLLGALPAGAADRYAATTQSLRTHHAPQWYEDAKLKVEMLGLGEPVKWRQVPEALAIDPPSGPAKRYGVREDNQPSKRMTIAIRECIAAIDLVHFMVHNIVVNRVNIHDAKTNLSRYLAELTPGKTLVLCNRNQPVAELRSLRKPGGFRKPRIGAARGEFVVPDSFFEPLPDEIIKAFSGG